MLGSQARSSRGITGMERRDFLKLGAAAFGGLAMAGPPGP